LSQLPRRHVLTALAATPLAGLSLATVLADPRLARAAASGLEEVSLTTASGRTVKAALAVPAATPAPAILLVHEWWGLNDQIKSVAAELAKDGYLALAIDLYDGKVAATPDDARAYMGAVDGKEATETLTSWIAWLKANPKSTGKIGTVGWCFGGGWSLDASIAAPVDATVVYYGRVNQPVDKLAQLKGPVLGHFATKDQWINPAMVAGFEAAMTKAGKSLEAYSYEANHAFANPTGASYDAEDAKLAWQRTLAFFKDHLKG
jgi:carboxymethylenebutenolidase